MSDWQKFLEDKGEQVIEAWNTITHRPGEVMICFVNRYLEGLDGIKYKVQYDGRVFESQTTADKYCVKISPASFDPIVTFVWSRMSNAYKKLDDVVPNVASKKLVRKILKTYKVQGQTEQHPKATPITPPPLRPAPAPAPGPSPKDKQGVNPVPKNDESGLPQTSAERPVPENITTEQLKKIFTAASEGHLQEIADELNKDLPKFKLDTAVRRAHFFGQARQETGPAITGSMERFIYTPSRLITVLGYYTKHPDEAEEDGQIVETVSVEIPDSKKSKKKEKKFKKVKKIIQEAKEEVIANKAYGQKGVGGMLGNKEPGDGWKYRGRGLKQTTGKGNYDTFKKEHVKYWGENIDFIASPDLVAQFPYTVRSAVVFWLANNCWKAADDGINDTAIDAVTKIVNSGEIINHRKGKYSDDNKNPVLNRRIYTRLAYSAFV